MSKTAIALSILVALVGCSTAPVQWSRVPVGAKHAYMPAAPDSRPTAVFLGQNGSAINMPEPATRMRCDAAGMCHLTRQ